MQLEIREVMMYFCVCLTDITVLKIFPCLSFISSSKFFCMSLLFPVFYNLKLHGQSCDISFITIFFSSFLKLCSTVACVLFDDVDGAVCSSMYMYHVCGLDLSQEKQLLS